MKLTRPQGYSSEEGARFDLEFTKARSFYGNDARKLRLRLDFFNKDGIWVVEDTRNTKDAAIIALLGKGMQQKKIADTVHCQPSNITRVKAIAKEKGYLDENGKLTPLGKELFQNIEISNNEKN